MMIERILIQIDDVVREATPEEAAVIRATQAEMPPLEGTDETPSPA
jgi:hypothetical protein